MALIAASALTRNTALIEGVKIVVINGKSLLRPQAKAFAVPSATMLTKTFQEPGFRKEPWPYKTKGYNRWHYLYEKTLPKFNDNTKVIVVDGPPCSGKTTLAKEIAEEFDMEYFPEPSADEFYTNEYGFNKRELNPQLPPRARFINKEDFYLEPTKRNATYYLNTVFKQSFVQYLQSLAHLLNTGQGVVLDKCFYSTLVDVLAMVECDYVRSAYKKYHNDVSFLCQRNIIRPHLIVYLDVPVDVVKERIKKRGIDYEVETNVLSTKYISAIEKFYKERYLTDMSPHCELLVYDWSNFGDAEVVVEDIERIDFDKYDKWDLKLQDWRTDRERQWANLRYSCTSYQADLMNLFNLEHAHIPEMWMTSEDFYTLRRVVMSHPTEMYAPGYNAHIGDKGVFWGWFPKGWKFNGIPD